MFAIKVAPIIGSAIGIGRYWVSVTSSVIVFFLRPLPISRLCHLEHVTFASESSGYIVALFAVGLFWVYGAWNIARKKDVTNMGLLRCQQGPLRSVPGLQQEGIRAAVGIARVILWDYTNLVQHLKDRHAQLHREFKP